MADGYPAMMTAAMCAADIGVTTVTIQSYVRKKLLPALKLGPGRGSYVIGGDDWQKFKHDVLPFLPRGRPKKDGPRATWKKKTSAA